MYNSNNNKFSKFKTKKEQFSEFTLRILINVLVGSVKGELNSLTEQIESASANELALLRFIGVQS